MSPLPFSEAAERNKAPILAVLEQWLTQPGRVLEIGAGTGQHAEHFARAMPQLVWQATDTGAYMPGLVARIRQADLPNLPPPLDLDVTRPAWPVATFDHVYSANTAHIMHWPAVEALFAGVGGGLRADGLFFLYGPFHRDGVPTSESNARFDADLRAKDPGMGIRDSTVLDRLAIAAGLVPVADVAMPANNRLLIWRRVAGIKPDRNR